eukprot:766097-Hanusia_phi.AAC.4
MTSTSMGILCSLEASSLTSSTLLLLSPKLFCCHRSEFHGAGGEETLADRHERGKKDVPAACSSVSCTYSPCGGKRSGNRSRNGSGDVGERRGRWERLRIDFSIGRRRVVHGVRDGNLVFENLTRRAGEQM